jgi:hypothetical protein
MVASRSSHVSSKISSSSSSSSRTGALIIIVPPPMAIERVAGDLDDSDGQLVLEVVVKARAPSASAEKSDASAVKD